MSERDLDELRMVAGLGDTSKIDWRAEYARLYDDAEKTETAMRAKIAALKQAAADQPAEAARMADELAELTGGGVAYEFAGWTERTPVWRFWLSLYKRTFYADTLAEAAQKARDYHAAAVAPPMPVPATVPEPTLDDNPF